jgi:hypothetical protein
MDELESALGHFKHIYAMYSMKMDRKYKTFGPVDSVQVQDAWDRYLKLRKQHRGF